MPTTLRKPKAKSQARIYERIENIYPKGHEEQAATKEFVRQELRAELKPINRDIKWLRWVLALGFGGLLTVMIYLHSDTKADMKELKADIDKRFEKMDKRFDKIESLLQKR